MLEASLIRNLQRSGPEADDADSTNCAARKYRTRAADLEPPFAKWSDNAPGGWWTSSSQAHAKQIDRVSRTRTAEI